MYSWEEKVEVKFQLNRHKDKITSLAFSSNSARLVSSSRDRSQLVWDVLLSGHLLSDLSGQKDAVRHCGVSKNQQLMLSVCGTEVTVWDFQSMEAISTLDHASQVMKSFFIPDNSGIISHQDNGTMIVWSL